MFESALCESEICMSALCKIVLFQSFKFEGVVSESGTYQSALWTLGKFLFRKGKVIILLYK